MASGDTRVAELVDHDCGTITAWFVVTVVYKSVQSPVIREQLILEKELAGQST